MMATVYQKGFSQWKGWLDAHSSAGTFYWDFAFSERWAA